MSVPAAISVAQYLDLVNDRLREVPSDVGVEGEVSDLRVSHGKWVSFDLKDAEAGAVLKCFMTVWQLSVPLEDGMRVRVTGGAKVSPKFGKFQMDVRAVELVGEGALKRAYLALKAKLQEEGLFDGARKRPLPRFPERVGLITSREAAAYGDFLRVLGNRWGGVDVLFSSVHVQGASAVPEILAAFAHFNALPEAERPDVLVLTRGGGGLEDLHAFNDESVARAVFSCRIPVVVGIGHERDESLCDYVADVRASTPSNAAERVCPSREEVRYEVESMARHVETRLREKLDAHRRTVGHVASAAGAFVSRERERLYATVSAFDGAAGRWIPRLRERVFGGERLLKNVDPTRVLARGYGIVSVGGHVARDASALEVGAEVEVRLARGRFDADVTRINGKGKQRLI
ncbi:exodeoxyribonuclease VII large subunit [Patescibacteria group bacterium]|nr:MAG: exodeoxyribonuclease VII large subunit [Patescibacteria group bacterium]